jgi:hypothetical protein
VDPDLSPDDNTQVLLRTVRMLQLGMEVQLLEQDNNTQEINALRDELQVGVPSPMTHNYKPIKYVDKQPYV